MSGKHLAAARTTTASERTVTGALVTALVLVLALGYGLIDNRWYRVLSVEGGSMQPAIERGDAIVLVRPPQRLEVGDIVTLQAEDTLVTHRIVAVADDGSFTTKGDANEAVDDWAGVDVRVVGRVVLTVPWLGSALAAFGSHAFFHDSLIRPGEVFSGEWAFPESEAEEALAEEDVPIPDETIPAPTDTTEPPESTIPTEEEDTGVTEDTVASEEKATLGTRP